MPTIRVPQDQPTIQAGVNAAGIGDVVLVSSGTYIESVVVNRSSVRIIAAEKHGVVLQAPSPGQNPLTLDQTTDVEVYGFVIQNSLRGIWVFRGGYHRSVENIMQNSGEGILFENSDGNFVYKNIIRNNNSDGIILGWDPGSRSNWLIENEFINNGGDGVDVWSFSAFGNALINNKFSGNSREGIRVNGQNTLLYGNEIENSSLNGINFVNADNSVAANNDLENNNIDDINIDNASSSIIVINNEAEGDGTGIEVNGNLNIVQGNDVEDNNDDGIQINGNDNVIIDNELEDNNPQNIDNNGIDNIIRDNDVD